MKNKFTRPHFYLFDTFAAIKNPSRPLSRPAIYHGQIFFYTAGFLEIGCGHGHLATLFGRNFCQIAQKWPKKMMRWPEKLVAEF
jgi:hypothetical protein